MKRSDATVVVLRRRTAFRIKLLQTLHSLVIRLDQEGSVFGRYRDVKVLHDVEIEDFRAVLSNLQQGSVLARPLGLEHQDALAMLEEAMIAGRGNGHISADLKIFLRWNPIQLFTAVAAGAIKLVRARNDKIVCLARGDALGNSILENTFL